MAMAMLPMAMATTERGLLMLSLRPMLMLTTMELMVLAMLDMDMVLAMLHTLLSMEAMAMVDMVLAMLDMVMLLPTPMVPTPMPTDMASKKSSAFSLIV